MHESNGECSKFLFHDFCLDPEAKICTSAGREIHLAKRPFEVLSFLVTNHDRVVSRTELLEKFWDGHDVYDDALRKCVAAIRKALNDLEKPGRFIETRYGGGYRFVADVKVLAKNGNGSSNGFELKSDPTTTQRRINRDHSISRPRISVRYLPVAAIAFLLFAAFGVGIYSFIQRPQSVSSANSEESGAMQVRSIAVMPMKNLTGDPCNDYFSDGITESIITQLSRVDELKVISRSSTFTFKDKELDPRDVGKQLGVDALLEGGVQKTGETINITVRLVSTKDGSVIWTGDDFERPISAAYDLKDVIACNLAIELRTELCGNRVDRQTNDGFAYQEYLKGRYEWNKRTGDGIKKSIEHYKKAIRLDPNYSLAHAGLADSYIQGIWHVPFAENEVLPKAREAVVQAIKLDDDSAEAHTAFASVYQLEWKWSEAEQELTRAIDLSPRYARAYHVQAFSLMISGRLDESIAAIEQAEKLDPLNLVIQADKGNLLLAAGRTDEAFSQWEKTSEMDPNFVMAYEHRARAYELLGNEAAAIDEEAKLMQIKGHLPEKIAVFRETAGKRGLKEIRRKELKDLLAKQSRGEHTSPVALAYYYALIGQKAEAFKYLEKACREHNGQMVLLISPEFASLRPDPRFNVLLKRIGLSGS